MSNPSPDVSAPAPAPSAEQLIDNLATAIGYSDDVFTEGPHNSLLVNVTLLKQMIREALPVLLRSYATTPDDLPPQHGRDVPRSAPSHQSGHVDAKSRSGYQSPPAAIPERSTTPTPCAEQVEALERFGLGASWDSDGVDARIDPTVDGRYLLRSDVLALFAQPPAQEQP